MPRILETIQTTPTEGVDAVAMHVLDTVFVRVTGMEPRGLRAYADGDALLLLLRFDPALLEPGVEVAFVALPALIADAVRERTGRRLRPGNLTVSAERGLAVFGFTVLDEPPSGGGRALWIDGALRLAS